MEMGKGDLLLGYRECIDYNFIALKQCFFCPFNLLLFCQLYTDNSTQITPKRLSIVIEKMALLSLLIRDGSGVGNNVSYSQP